MIIERKHKTLIQQLAESCFEGISSEDVINRVKDVMRFFGKNYPRNAKAFASYFWTCLQKEFGKKYAIINYAGPLDLKQLNAFLTNENVVQIVAEEHSELIGGIKVQHGDNVWDYSIQGQLQALIKTLK